MARQPMVTRTMTATKVKAIFVNLDTHEVSEKEIELPRKLKDEKAILKAMPNVKLEGNWKFVSVVSFDYAETYRGMTEAEFLQYSRELPPLKTKKA